MNNSKEITTKELLVKATKYCAYQERATSEVRQKLVLLGANSSQIEQVIDELYSMSFINEERYAKVITSGKFRLKNWGKIKIKAYLKAKQIPQHIINSALDEIPDNEYLDTLSKLIKKKSASLRETDFLMRKKKLINFLLQRGFEYNLINDLLE